MERRIVAQMLTCMDDLAEQHSSAQLPDAAPLQNKHVVVIGMPQLECLLGLPPTFMLYYMLHIHFSEAGRLSTYTLSMQIDQPGNMHSHSV